MSVDENQQFAISLGDVSLILQDRLEKLNKNVAKETARQRAAIEACH